MLVLISYCNFRLVNKKKMAKVNIDGKEYEFESLTDNQKAQLVSLKFVQDELKRLNAQLAVYKTA